MKVVAAIVLVNILYFCGTWIYFGEFSTGDQRVLGYVSTILVWVSTIACAVKVEAVVREKRRR